MSTPQPKVILIVDDEEPVRMMERRILENAGYEVVEAADGAAALAILQGDTKLELQTSANFQVNARDVNDLASSNSCRRCHRFASVCRSCRRNDTRRDFLGGVFQEMLARTSQRTSPS